MTSQSRENGHFGNNMASPGQYTQQMSQLQQNQFLALCNVSGFQNNFYQQPKPQVSSLQAFSNENSFNFPSPRSVIDNNAMIQVAQQFNQFGQLSPIHSSTPMKTPFASMMQVDSSPDAQLTQTLVSNALEQKMKLLYGLQRIALKGCESAARIFQSHSKRPYFKKIDLLCDRLKQDLGVTDKAVVNINSHGVAWAIKDFIFVFNRIISGWVILRDYFYSNTDGMNCVNESIDPDMVEDFIQWQEATLKLAQSLVQSFENLHNRDQRNSNRKGAKSTGSNNCSPNSSPGDLQNSFQKIFDPLVVEDSGQLQLGGGYLKSAVYKPLSSSEGSMHSAPSTPSSTSRDFASFKLLFNDGQPENFNPNRSGKSMPLYKRSNVDSASVEKTSTKRCNNQGNNRLKVNLANKFEAVNLNNNIDESFFDHLLSSP